jgi:hypothetical protein
MYIIKSVRVGIVGTEFVPKPKTNVAALIWGGFIEEVKEPIQEVIKEVSTPAPKKGAKNKKATNKE